MMKASQLVAFAAAAALSFGQSKSATPPPMIIVATHGSGATMNLTLTNVSGRAISASVVLVTFRTPKGSQVQAVDLEDSSLLPQATPLAPGAQATGAVSIPTQLGAELVIDQTQVDYVLFTDGSSWGPDTAHVSLQIKGMRAGWARAYSHLNATLKRQGKDAVTEEIQSYVASKRTLAKATP